MKKKIDIKNKIKILENKYSECEKQVKINLEGWKRAKADYVNLKKRVENDRSENIKYANKELILNLLPILDNFKSAYNTLPREMEDNDWARGIGYIKDQLEKFLKDYGVEKIKTRGIMFDPEFHEAVEKVKSKEKKGLIIEEILAGYRLNEKVIRPARVKVSG